MRWLAAISAVFTLVWAVSAPSPSFAAAFDCDRALLAALDRKECPYLSNQCYTNTIGVLEYAVKHIPGFEIEKAKIVYFHSPGELMDVFEARQAKRWAYHVVIEYGGLIFDQDRRDRSRLVSTADYVAGMFRPQTGLNPRAKAVVVPALDYLIEFGNLDPDGKLVEPENYYDGFDRIARAYPVVTLNQFASGDFPAKTTAYDPAAPLPAEPRLGLIDNILYWRDGGVIIALEPSTADIRIIMPNFRRPSRAQIERFREIIDRRSRESEAIAHIWRWFLRVEENRSASSWFRFLRP